MWSGRIVPLLSQDRLIAISSRRRGHSLSVGYDKQPLEGFNATEWIEEAANFENLLLPLPIDVTAATGIRNGSTVYVSWWVNSKRPTDTNGIETESNIQIDSNFAKDMAACVIISPFPFEIFTNEVLQLIVRLQHQDGALYTTIVSTAAKVGAQVIQLEGMSTGTESTLIHFPIPNIEDKWNSMYNFLWSIEQERNKKKPLILDWYAKVPRRFDEWIVRKHDDSINSEDLERADKYYAVWHRIFRLGLLEEIFDNDEKSSNNDEKSSKFPRPFGRSEWKGCLKEDQNGKFIRINTTEAHKFTEDRRGSNNRPNFLRETVIDEMCNIPWGRINREYLRKIKENEDEKEHLKEEFKRHGIPRYALLVREPDLPVVIAIIPRRALFHIKVPLRSSTLLHEKTGEGALGRILDVLKERKINIWHISLLPTTMDFEVSGNTQAPTNMEATFAKADLRIVAAFPDDWLDRDEKSQKMAFHDLEDNISNIRLAPSLHLNNEIFPGTEIVELIKNAKKTYTNENTSTENIKVAQLLDPTWSINLLLKKLKEKEREGHEEMAPEMRRLATWVESMKNREGEPIIQDKRGIVTGAPPLLRIFFSHSATPAAEEQDYINDIRRVLSIYSMSILEGTFSTGHNTDELSRGRIRQCTALVSLFWPRDEFVDSKGQFLPAEWIAHEESYALGLGLGVYRIIESSVRIPRYEQDRPALSFTKGDGFSWNTAIQRFQKELEEFLFNEYRRFVLLDD